MKRLYSCLLFLICLTCVAPVFAQNDFARFQMDSLQKVLARQTTTKDSVHILQQLVDFTPVRSDETLLYPDHISKLLEINKKLKLIDPAPYQLLQEGNQYWHKKQYRESLGDFQEAITLFDKQHKVIYPLLLNIRILYNLINNQDDRLHYYQQKLEYYLVNGPYQNTAACYHAIGGFYLYKGAFNQAINNYLKGAEIFRKFDWVFYSNVLDVVGATYNQWGNFKKASYYLKMALPITQKMRDSSGVCYGYSNMCQVAYSEGRYDDALNLVKESLSFGSKRKTQRIVGITVFKAGIYLKLNQPDMAFTILTAMKPVLDSGQVKTVSSFGYTEVDYDFYLYYLTKGDIDQAEKSLLKANERATEEKGIPLQLKYLRELGYFYQRQNKPELSAKYFDQYFKVYDAREKGLNDFRVAQYEVDQNDRAQNDHINQLKQEKAVQDYELSRRNALLWGSLTVLVLISALLVFIYRQFVVNKKTLIALRQTQRQLVQSEKMASLGELTAGIAHEIQNPLNFVNNFSEVNIELVDEMELELSKGDKDEAIAIAVDIRQNLEKIRHHGQRADGIVKGMLQHSRASSGKKEPTNINELADEYFRLAYHGLRAKDKSFNSELVTHFDDNLPNVDTIPQDIGRVLLNLFTNAFYAVTQKQKKGITGYKPTVELSTGLKNGNIEIKVKDNGTGMPDHIKDKIMQPFFTTKPTGEGTGLGLSMSYDIVVKGHGGSINVETREGEYTEFTITLPLDQK